MSPPDPLAYLWQRCRALMPGKTADEIEHLMVTSTVARVEMCRDDPLLFALLYLSKHLKDEQGRMSLADLHVEVAQIARRWALGAAEPMAERHAVIAPRECGKSTWCFLILPLWAAAYGYSRFTMAVSNSGEQAKMHLSTLRRELETNELLRRDFGDLCKMRRRPSGTSESDNQSLIVTKSGFAMAARGIDSGILGVKHDEARPDLVILDDIEPHAEQYSLYQSEKRLGTVINTLFPMNLRARVLIAGTVVMPQSIIHSMVRHALGEQDEATAWVAEERIQVHYLPALYEVDGEKRSVWPVKWPVDFLLSIAHTAGYLLNFMNRPRPREGLYWAERDVVRLPMPESARLRTIICVDPPVTATNKSDWAGIAVLSQGKDKRVYVRHVAHYKATGRALRERVERLMTVYPEARVLVVEVNQGGDLWKENVFNGLPIKIRTTWSAAPKDVRAGELLDHYQMRRVVHANDWDDGPYLEELLNFPGAPHVDDQIDAVGSGGRYFLPSSAKKVLRTAVA